jgi:ethanolamine ammonia-lyase small subunit
MHESNSHKAIIKTDGWSSLKKLTNARIALGRAGISVPVNEMLQFKMAHAQARDEVFSLLNMNALLQQLNDFNLAVYHLKSQASDKHIYLKRPDLGRRLHEDSVKQLTDLKNTSHTVCITITDGLSATAVNNHAIQILALLIPMLTALKLNIAPICLVENGRVAIADETASLLNSKLSLILIGERPGLSSPDSLGAYITYQPRPGLTDESRNCISNIRPEGLSYKQATDRISYLIREAIHLKLSGIGLKENAINTLLY